MKKLFLAMMAVAAITFVGCKPQNEPEKDKDQEPGGETKVTLTDVKLYYDVKLTGKIADYVKLNLRYIEIPDSNNIAVKENIVADWKYDEYTVEKGNAAVYGIEPSIRVTELFKQTFSSEEKNKTMVESNSTLVITMGYIGTFSDGHVDVWPIGTDSIGLSNMPFDKSQEKAMIDEVEGAKPFAHSFLWDKEGVVHSEPIHNFWYRH